MREESIVEAILRAVREVQQQSGREVEEIGPETRPIGDLGDFDSLNAVEATIKIEEYLGCELNDDQVFSDPEENKALCVTEIADRIGKMIGRSEDEIDG